MPRYTNQSMKRVEDAPLVTGQGTFVDDIVLPDMRYAAMVRSPHAHARIVRLDTTMARAMPGVVEVLTADAMAPHVRTLPAVPRPGAEYMTVPEHPVLAQEAVYYVGQPVAVVVAEQREQAQDAVACVDIEYQPLPALTDPLAALQADRPPVHPAMASNLALRMHTGRGRMEAARSQADRLLHGVFESPRLSALPVEGRGIVAAYTADDDQLTLWTSTQVPYRIRLHLTEVLRHAPASIRVVAPDVGGGFGQKVELWAEYVAVCFLAIKLRQPIKWIEGRIENFMAYHGRGFTAEVEAAVKRDGTILGMRFDMVADLGAYMLAFSAAAPVNVTKRVAGPYAIPTMEVTCRGVITNKPPTGPYRGAGGPEGAFFMERMVDQIAHELNLDPAVVRRRNLVPSDAFPYTAATGQVYDTGHFEAALDRVLTLADYNAWRDAQQRREAGGNTLIGIGLATVVKGAGGVGQSRTSHARVRVQPTGQIDICTEISPHGQGTATTFAQIAADVLGVHPQDVRVLYGDTDMLPAGQGTYASRGLTVGGSAVYVGLQKARDALVRLASHILECAPDDIVLREGSAYNRQYPHQPLPLSQIVTFAQEADQLPEGIEASLTFPVTYSLPENPYAFAAHVVVVAVDRQTGEVRCLRYVAVHDPGPLINPMLTRGQIHGGIVQGIGQALTEGLVYSREGQPLNCSLMDYAAPRSGMCPDMTVETLPTPSTTNPLGIKGIGELPTVAAPAAVANAVLDALAPLGIRHIDIPLTPEKLWRALHHTMSGV